MQVGFYLLTFVSLSTVAATLLPLVPSDEWWIRIFDFPRAQLLVIITISILLLIAGLLCNLWAVTKFHYFLLTLLASAMAIQAYWIVPFVPGFPREVPTTTDHKQQHRTLDILVANLKFDNTSYKNFHDLVTEHSPHLIFVTEYNDAWHNQLKQLDDQYPHSVKVVKDDGHGMALFSIEKLSNEKERYLISDQRPSISARLHLNESSYIELWGLHPAPPGIKMSNEERKDSSPRDAELLVVADRVADYAVPTIVMGDLNDTAWSQTTMQFKKISGLLDPRIGRGLFNTYHTEYLLLRYPIDHFFLSNHFYIHSIKRLRSFGSDHFPMLLSVSVENPYFSQKSNGEGELTKRQEKTIQEGKEDAQEHDQHKEVAPD